MQILYDHDLVSIDIDEASRGLRRFLIDDFAGKTVSPPRHSINFGDDHLVFTTGGDCRNFGFRSYSYRVGLERDVEDQIVACWDRSHHRLLGVALGSSLGAWRTGILGGIARETVGPKNYDVCGVIGTGVQATTQVLATARLSPPERFLVFSRSAENRKRFAEVLCAKSGIPTETASNAEALVRQSDCLIVATSSGDPVIDIDWLENCQHVTTVGPKSSAAHELPSDILDWARLVVSDSPQQIAAQGVDHFLSACTNAVQVQHLGQIIDQVPQPTSVGRSLYLSAGLAGTEVALLACLLND